MRALLSTGLIALGLSCVSQAESLKETYQQALENDHTFKAAKAEYNAGKQAKALGRAGLLPQLSGKAYKEKTQLKGTTLGTASVVDPNNPENSTNVPAIVDQDTEIDTTGYQVALSQTLFNLSSWHTFKQGAAQADAATAVFRSAEQSLIIRTAEAYLDVLRAADNLETAKAEENALSHQLEQTKQRFEVGLTAITGVHEAQAAFDSAVASRLQAEGQLGIAFESLEQITGKSYSSLSSLKKNFPVTMPEPMAREEWVQSALQNNFQLKASSLSAKAAKQSAKAAKANHFPTLGLSASYTNESKDNGFPEEQEPETQYIGITLNVPIFSGGSLHASRKRAYAEANQRREEFNQSQRNVIQQTRSLHLQVVTSVSTVKARRQAITSNQSALDATQAGYEVGTRDLVDVLNAQRNLYIAQRNYFNSLYDYILSTLRLKETAGILAPDAIDQLDQHLDHSKSVLRF